MKNYLELLKEIRSHGDWKEPARPGMPRTLELNGRMMKFDLQEGFPAMTTKKLAFKVAMAELCSWILGVTNVRYLWQYNCHVWDDDAYRYYLKRFPTGFMTKEEWMERVKEGADIGNFYKFGDCGRIYGAQWRRWCGTYDQLQALIDSIRERPNERYHIVSAWDAIDFKQQPLNAALPACHAFWQCIVRDKKYVDMVLMQRSADFCLGVPFNIAQYSALLTLIAQCTSRQPGVLTWVGGSCHIYENQIAGVDEQLSREPLSLPTLELDQKATINTIKPEDFKLVGYQYHPKIEYPLNTGVN